MKFLSISYWWNIVWHKSVKEFCFAAKDPPVVSLCRLLLAIIFFCRPQNSRTHCVYIHQSSQEARRIWKELVGKNSCYHQSGLSLCPWLRVLWILWTPFNLPSHMVDGLPGSGRHAAPFLGALNNHDTDTRWETVREMALEDSEKSNFICSEKKGGRGGW